MQIGINENKCNTAECHETGGRERTQANATERIERGVVNNAKGGKRDAQQELGQKGETETS